MAESSPKKFKYYDPSVAQGLMSSHDEKPLKGLPGFLGIQIRDYAEGSMSFELPLRKDLLTPFGNVHGGVMAAFCDHMLGLVCYPHLQAGQWAATTEFKLNYLVPVREGALLGEASLVSMTRSSAVVRMEVHNQDRLACIAQGTVTIVDPR